ALGPLRPTIRICRSRVVMCRYPATLSLTLASLLAIGITSPSPAQISWPTKAWPTATPRSVGLNPAVFDSIDAEITAGRYGYVDRMVVIRHGKLVWNRSYHQDYARAYAD